MTKSKNGAIGQGKGGGPKTLAGKANVSRNAIKHGIMSKAPVVQGMENEQDWKLHLAGVIDSLEPEGHLEAVLAERIASVLWRFNRVIRYETSVTFREVDLVEHDLAVSDAYRRGKLAEGDLREQPPALVAAERETRLLSSPFHLDKIMRYESHLHRLFVQTLHQLEAVQARRMGQPTTLTRVDFSSPPAQLGNTSNALPAI